jgi:asparagine synthase (glutamine-hydrolysing)
MCAAAPLRGARVETMLHGRVALAVSNRDDLVEAHLGAAGGLAVAFCGVLDDARDLARTLELDDQPGPAELVAAGFASGRDAFVRGLRGVFAAVVTDGDSVWCFRDHLGYGLLFYRAAGDGIYAASEAKQVVAGAQLAREPDLDVVERVFYGLVDDEMPSALRGVQRLPKATIGEAAPGTAALRLDRYWRPETLLETSTLRDDELQAAFDDAMSRAARRSLTGHDVVLLSGGVDSPAVAAYAAPEHRALSGEPLHAVTAVYPRHQSVDEREYVEPLAAGFGIPLHTYEPAANALGDLARWVELADGPYPAASLAQYAESYAVSRDLGFRRILTGEHAEVVMAMNWYLLEHLLAHGRPRSVVRQLRARRRRGDSIRSLALELGQSAVPARLLAARERRNGVGVPAWIDVRRASDAAAGRIVGVRQRWRQLQLSAFLGPGLSAEATAVCQAVHGVHARRPWADVDVFELFLGLRAEQKFPWAGAKSLVRRLLRGRVPDVILDRRDKTVFDEAALAAIDYATLERYLVRPAHRLPGVDYPALEDLLRRREITMLDYKWATKLANVHAFLAQW